MYQALFGEHLLQDGVQLKWLAPTETFLAFGVEAARGQFFPGSEAGGNRNSPGAWAAFAKVGGDFSASHSWRAGSCTLGIRTRSWVSSTSAAPSMALTASPHHVGGTKRPSAAVQPPSTTIVVPVTKLLASAAR